MDPNRLQSNQSFFDLSDLDSLRSQALEGDPEKKALKQVAAQFESIFTQMLFKSMRKANEAFEDQESPFNASSVKFYRDMHDQQLSMELSQSGALGLADIIVEQLAPTPGKYTPASFIRPDFEAQIKNQIEAAKVNKNSDEHQARMSAQPANLQQDAAPQTAEEFVESIWDYAKQAASKIGLNPAVLVAQAALETGWGKHVIKKADGMSSNNLFNIKSDNSWHGDKANKVTLEYENGVAVKRNAAFRAYDNVAKSFDDFIGFLQQNPRYENALTHTGESTRFIDELQRAGYATDPNYANKIKDVLNRIEIPNLAGKILPQGVK